MIKSIDAGSQAEGHPELVAGLVITAINGTDITGMVMREIGAVVKASDRCELQFAAEINAATAPPKAARPSQLAMPVSPSRCPLGT